MALFVRLPSEKSSYKNTTINRSYGQSATILDYYKVSSIVMSTSATSENIRDQDAFANKKHQHKQHESGLSSHPAEPKSDLNIDKLRLDDPFKLDSPRYLTKATYSSRSKPSDRDAVHDESVYSTPVGKSQAATPAIDTLLPASASKKDLDTSAKNTDDYNKVVRVIHDHTAKELPRLPQREPGLDQIKSKAQASCCCGHKTLEESAAATKAKGESVKKLTEQGSAAEQSAEKSAGQEEKDEGDDTVIVTIRATERSTEPAVGKIEQVEEVHDLSEGGRKGEKEESAGVEGDVKAEQ